VTDIVGNPALAATLGTFTATPVYELYLAVVK
jgi:hypothetical protein